MLRIILIAIALALDAFGVALGLSCSQNLQKKEKGLIILSFGFFQALFTFLGAVFGRFVNLNFFNITGYLSGTIIFIMGLLLLKEGHSQNQNDEESKLLSTWAYIILGISVSIDALGVGFSVLYKDPLVLVTFNSIYIGMITSFLTFCAFPLSGFVKNIRIVEKYADYLGGIILILFGLKMFIG